MQVFRAGATRRVGDGSSGSLASIRQAHWKLMMGSRQATMVAARGETALRAILAGTARMNAPNAEVNTAALSMRQ